MKQTAHAFNSIFLINILKKRKRIKIVFAFFLNIYFHFVCVSVHLSLRVIDQVQICLSFVFI